MLQARSLTFHPLANIFPLLEGADFSALADDIAEHGLREMIVLYDGAILDGRNRFRACEAAGVEPKFAEYEGDDPVGYVISLNLRRRHLDESQRSLVASKLENVGHGGDRKSSDQNANLHLDRAGAAAMLNVSPRSVATAAKVLDEGAPELVAAVERGEVSVSAAADVATLPKAEQVEIVARGEKEILQAAKQIRAGRAEVSRDERIAKIAEISRGNAPLGTAAKYPVLYVDPPWKYENPPMGAGSRSIENHYPTLTLEEICALPVSDLATDDAILYLWATAPKLAECMTVIEAWGFNYRTNFVWVKDKIGMGYHARSQHELLLVCRRGDIPPPAVDDRVSSVVFADREGHSEKPREFYDLIEKFYPTLPRIELFCRGAPRAGWAAWGNQAVAA